LIGTNELEACRSDRRCKNKKSPPRGELFLFLKWMGWQDSNLRMTESKSVVLPLDDTPSSENEA
jgi:hypothetical protein